jgi:hypothetical protein
MAAREGEDLIRLPDGMRDRVVQVKSGLKLTAFE